MTGKIGLGRRVFMIFERPRGIEGTPPIGTGFQVHRAGCVLTAKHVVTGQETVFVVVTAGKTLEVIESERIITHPEADVAAITIPRMTREATECYQLWTPPTGYKEFPIGEEVAAYGYPKWDVRSRFLRVS